MYYFHNDYNETCHPAVTAKILASSTNQFDGYGMDESCKRAAALIRKECGREDASVHFLVGGTQTNLTVIAASLRPYQGVLAATTGHINVHETGAIEATGHKVIQLPGYNGKLTSQQVESAVLEQRNSPDAEHIVQPKMVYISNPTEYGTTYSLAELEALASVCRAHNLFLFIDGARLGYALASENYDVTMADIARLADVFYIGGTKVGAMFGEALVITNSIIAEDFRYMLKQHGAMLAKGWLLGLQFEALFEDGLYTKISHHADVLADSLRKTLQELNCPLVCKNKTNQVFVTLPNTVLAKLADDFTFAVWETVDNEQTTVRFCTSWATQVEAVTLLCARLKELMFLEL